MASLFEDIALHEFEYSFGEAVRELDPDGILYDYLFQEFCQGVTYGLKNLEASREELETEAAVRYLFKEDSFVEMLQDELQEGTRKSTGFVFLYGAFWGRESLKDNGNSLS